MITRRKDYSKSEPTKDASKIYIVCEGKGSEPDYFGFFEGLSSNLELIVIPPEEGTDPLKLMELAEHILLSETRRYTIDYLQRDKVWFAIDTDSWEKEGKIAPLRDFCKDMNARITENTARLNRMRHGMSRKATPALKYGYIIITMQTGRIKKLWKNNHL